MFLVCRPELQYEFKKDSGMLATGTSGGKARISELELEMVCVWGKGEPKHGDLEKDNGRNDFPGSWSQLPSTTQQMWGHTLAHLDTSLGDILGRVKQRDYLPCALPSSKAKTTNLCFWSLGM